MDLGGGFNPRPVPGTEYHVKPLTWADMVEILAMDETEQRYRLVERSVCDAHGGSLIAAGEAGQLPAPLALRLFEAANRINSLGEDAMEASEGN